MRMNESDPTCAACGRRLTRPQLFRLHEACWRSMPLGLRQLWWEKTDYGRLAPDEELATLVRSVSHAG